MALGRIYSSLLKVYWFYLNSNLKVFKVELGRVFFENFCNNS